MQFYLSIQNENKDKSYGKIIITDKHSTKFHNGPKCIDKVVEGPFSFPKYNVTIGWQSPPMNSGCIIFQ